MLCPALGCRTMSLCAASTASGAIVLAHFAPEGHALPPGFREAAVDAFPQPVRLVRLCPRPFRQQGQHDGPRGVALPVSHQGLEPCGCQLKADASRLHLLDKGMDHSRPAAQAAHLMDQSFANILRAGQFPELGQPGRCQKLGAVADFPDMTPGSELGYFKDGIFRRLPEILIQECLPF